jgi:hypothetical protein
MKYLEALKIRGLSVENLPKALQKKINDLDLQASALKEVEENDNQDLTEADLEDLKVIKSSVNDLDNYIAHKVNIFDQTKYDAKLANVSKAKTARETLRKDREVEKQEINVKAPEVEEQEVEEPEVEEPEVVEPIVVKVQQEPKQVEVQAPKQVQEPQVSDETQIGYETTNEQEEEFEKVDGPRPKSMTTGLILMGVGAFFLTWGAVNFFKSRR